MERRRNSNSSLKGGRDADSSVKRRWLLLRCTHVFSGQRKEARKDRRLKMLALNIGAPEETPGEDYTQEGRGREYRKAWGAQHSEVSTSHLSAFIFVVTSVVELSDTKVNTGTWSCMCGVWHLGAPQPSLAFKTETG